MAHPKRKISKTRRNKRRTHYKAVAPHVVPCNNCGSATLWHHVCNECGHYRGQVAVDKDFAG